MKYTSAQANKLLKKLNEDYDALAEQERLSYTFVASIEEDEEELRPEYDYDTTQDQLNEIENMIRIIKHAINQFNVSTVVEGFDMTIDEMLVYIPQLNRKKQKLQFMKSKMPKARSMNAFMKNIIDYEYVNYDLDAVKADFEAVSEELTKAQLALDKVNNSIEFEIEV